MSDSVYLVPVFDIGSLQCTTVAVSAASECAAVWEALHCSPSLRYTGGKVELVEADPATAVAFDPWADRHKPERLKETAE
jgi:hypothetical protein